MGNTFPPRGAWRALALGLILTGLPCGSAHAQGGFGFPAVWKQTETPDSGERTVEGTFVWDAARKTATAKWNNGAIAVLNVVTDDGTTVVLCRFDPAGSSVGQVADYVGVRKGNKISGKVFWRDPLRDKQRSGTWTATIGVSNPDLSGTWTIAPSKDTAFGSGFTRGKGVFRLEKTEPDNFMIAGKEFRSRIRFSKDQLQFLNEAAALGATGKMTLDGSGVVRRITWSDGSVWTRNP